MAGRARPTTKTTTIKAPQRDPITLTIAETAALIGCSQYAVRQAIADGVLPAFKIGPRIWRVRESDVHAFIGSRAAPL